MSIQYTARDSNPRPLDREPPPITTRPGLPPYLQILCLSQYLIMVITMVPALIAKHTLSSEKCLAVGMA